ncbi:MAG: thioredoxin-disulfide reductase, partial [Candidatus Margulisiibacteriota bacterium]
PAGLTAAIYAGRARLKTLLIEKALLGGIATTSFLIENYPGFPKGISGMELGERFEEQAKLFGLEIIYGNVDAIHQGKEHKTVTINGKDFETRSIIIASGTSPKKLNIKGEEEYRGRGVSYCATCDGPFYKNKIIAVVGGGNTAAEEALYLTRFAEKIFLIHRRNKLRADRVLAERLQEHPKIFVLWSHVLNEIVGSERSVNRLVVKDRLSKRKKNIDVSGVFIYVGSTPQTAFAQNIIKLNRDKYIMTDPEMRTSAEGIFAAGDCRKKILRQIVTAAADGAIAANSAIHYLSGSSK